jgi:hypothetical protein
MNGTPRADVHPYASAAEERRREAPPPCGWPVSPRALPTFADAAYATVGTIRTAPRPADHCLGTHADRRR